MFHKLDETLHGYAKEALTTVEFLARQKHPPLKKFVIFGVPRSGSTLLVDLLDSHPMIHCEDELLLHKLGSPAKYVRRRTALSKTPVYGFKLLSDHFDLQAIPDPRRFLADLSQDGYQIISLVRLDLFRAALSSLYAQHMGKYHHKVNEGELIREKMTVKPEELGAKIARFERLVRLHAEALGSLPRLELSYEHDLLAEGAHQATVDEIADFIGIPRSAVTTQLVKVTTDDVSEFVANSAELAELMNAGHP